MFKLICIVFALLFKFVTRDNEFLIWGIVVVLMDIMWQNGCEDFKHSIKELPEEMFCCPKYFKFIFPHVGFKSEHVPKLALVETYLFFGQMVLVNVLYLFIIIKEPLEEFTRIDEMVGCVICFVILDMFLVLFSSFRLSVICFRLKFKK